MIMKFYNSVFSYLFIFHLHRMLKAAYSFADMELNPELDSSKKTHEECIKKEPRAHLASEKQVEASYECQKLSTETVTDQNKLHVDQKDTDKPDMEENFSAQLNLEQFDPKKCMKTSLEAYKFLKLHNNSISKADEEYSVIKNRNLLVNGDLDSCRKALDDLNAHEMILKEINRESERLHLKLQENNERLDKHLNEIKTLKSKPKNNKKNL